MSDPADKPVETAPAAAPAADPAPAASEAGAAPAAEQTPAAPVAEPTLLEQAAAPKADDKPADAPAAEAAPAGDKPADKPEGEAAVEAKDKPKDGSDGAAEKPAEAAGDKPTEPAKPEPIEYKYELPEVLKMDDAIKGDVHAAFDAFRADPANAQPLIDLHTRMLTEGIKAEQQRQWDFFNDTRKEWRNAVMADPMIGGSGHQTAMTAIAQMRDTFASDHKAGTPEHARDLEAFDGFLRATGAGDHPVFLRMLHRVSQVYAEPRLGPTDIKPAPVKEGGKVLYDNPRSRGNGVQ